MTKLLDLGNVEQVAPPVISKQALAEELGVSASRISQLCDEGLPQTSNGKIPRQQALDWYCENIDANRRRAFGTAPQVSAKARLDEVKAELAQLELDKAKGNLIDRKKAEKLIFERARAERDDHLAWIARVAPVLAAELKTAPTATFAALDREMRAHLTELSKTEFKALNHG